MGLLAGIDEAGYGPLLGPLVVSAVAVVVPDQQLETCLWNTLADTCTSRAGRHDGRLIVADSKTLYKNRSSLALLERTALVMLAAAGQHHDSSRGLLEGIWPQPLESLLGYPWYAGRDVKLPLADGVGDIATRANAVRRNLRRAGIGGLSVFGESLLVRQFNELVTKTGNKSVVLVGLVMRLLDKLIRSAREGRIRICVDRLGGRQHYREMLMTSFPAWTFQILMESPDRSAYRMSRSNTICEVEFVARGEQHHFAIALASVFSKYVREIYMHLLNTYWCGELPGLKPTAGYYTDARRWLAALSETLRRQRLDHSILVRAR